VKRIKKKPGISLRKNKKLTLQKNKKLVLFSHIHHIQQQTKTMKIHLGKRQREREKKQIVILSGVT